MDRRTFIQQAALGAGIGALAGTQNIAAQNTPTESFTFAVIADPHCGEDAKKGLEKYGRGVDKLLLCLDKITALEAAKKPEFILLLGDIHPWILKDYKDRLAIPVHAVAGNHEAIRYCEQRGISR